MCYTLRGATAWTDLSNVDNVTDPLQPNITTIMVSVMTGSVEQYVNNDYPSDFLKGMMTQRHNEQFTDVELESDDIHIPCHKNVLAAASPYFNAMFTSGMRECASRIVPLKVDSATLAGVVDYFYTAEIEFTVDNVQRLVQASDLLQLDDLKTACEKFILKQVKAANCIGFFKFASLHRLEQLQGGAWQVMLQRFKSVVSASEFKELSCQELIEYLSDDGINVEDENIVFESVLVWTRHDLDNRQTSLRKLLEHVRLPYCTIDYLHQVVDTGDVLTPECREYIHKAARFHMQATLRHEISSCRMVARTSFNVKRRLLVVGGLNTARYLHASVVVGDTVYVVGGKGADGKVVKTFERLNVKRRQRTSLPDMPQSVYFPMAVSYGSGVYVFGGRDAKKKSASCARMYTMWGEWRTLTDMPEVCDIGSVVTLNSYIYVVGGYRKSCMRYDPATDCWKRLSKPRLEHGNAPAVVWQGNILVAGGGGDSKTKSSVIEQYDIEKDEWSDWDTELTAKLSGHFVFNVDLYDTV
ncbi:Ring canal kelch protein [Lamellibrachia satsuma]|nr:Ring canal kelch protein [Lamellibrachia satsuma]